MPVRKQKNNSTIKDNQMKNLKFASSLIAALMLTTVVGCASTSTAKH
jgi:multisubunit Na+/H+ antiporter MnhC subunit